MAPRGTGLLEQHFTLNLAIKTSKTGQDYNCKYCDFSGKGWQGPGAARADLSGKKGHGFAACPNVPKDVKETLLKKAEEKLKQKEHQQNKKRIFLSQQNPDAAAEPSPKKQATLDNLQEILKSELDVSFAEFMYHAGIPFHISEDVMLRRYIDKLIQCVRAGLPVSQLYPPNRHKVADGLLNTVYDNISKEIGPVFAADHHTGLATDGYSNIRRQSVINYNLIGRRGSVIVKADYPGKQVNNADHIAQGIHDALEVVPQLQLPCPTSTVVAENAAVMHAALNVLDQSQELEVDHFLTNIGCTILGYNLLFKDLCALPTRFGSHGRRQGGDRKTTRWQQEDDRKAAGERQESNRKRQAGNRKATAELRQGGNRRETGGRQGGDRVATGRQQETRHSDRISDRKANRRRHESNRASGDREARRKRHDRATGRRQVSDR